MDISNNDILGRKMEQNSKYCENCGVGLNDENIGDWCYELCHFCLIDFRKEKGGN